MRDQYQLYAPLILLQDYLKMYKDLQSHIQKPMHHNWPNLSVIEDQVKQMRVKSEMKLKIEVKNIHLSVYLLIIF